MQGPRGAEQQRAFNALPETDITTALKVAMILFSVGTLCKMHAMLSRALSRHPVRDRPASGERQAPNHASREVCYFAKLSRNSLGLVPQGFQYILVSKGSKLQSF